MKITKLTVGMKVWVQEKGRNVLGEYLVAGFDPLAGRYWLATTDLDCDGPEGDLMVSSPTIKDGEWESIPMGERSPSGTMLLTDTKPKKEREKKV